MDRYDSGLFLFCTVIVSPRDDNVDRLNSENLMKSTDMINCLIEYENGFAYPARGPYHERLLVKVRELVILSFELRATEPSGSTPPAEDTHRRTDVRRGLLVLLDIYTRVCVSRNNGCHLYRQT